MSKEQKGRKDKRSLSTNLQICKTTLKKHKNNIQNRCMAEQRTERKEVGVRRFSLTHSWIYQDEALHGLNALLKRLFHDYSWKDFGTLVDGDLWTIHAIIVIFIISVSISYLDIAAYFQVSFFCGTTQNISILKGFNISTWQTVFALFLKIEGPELLSILKCIWFCFGSKILVGALLLVGILTLHWGLSENLCLSPSLGICCINLVLFILFIWFNSFRKDMA